MNIIGPDVSFWQDNNETLPQIDFQKMKSNGAEFVIIRSGQNEWQDPDFVYNWRMAKQAGLPRGSYWFYDSRLDPIEQAQLYINTLAGDLGELPLWADFEEKYGGPFPGWKNFYKFCLELERLAPDHELGIYTNYYYWRENVPAAERERFSKLPLWIANYNPGAPLIPEPWSSWLFHQYTDQGPGKAFGAESNRIDLNYFNGSKSEFVDRFKLQSFPEDPPPPTNTRYLTHKGVEVNIIERFGAKCIVHIIDPKIARVYVTPTGNFRPVSAAVEKYGAAIGTNGGGWPNIQTPGHRSNEIWASDGFLIQATALHDRGYINIDMEGRPAVSENDKLMKGLRNAWGFDRILGKNGEFNSKISDRTVKDARTGAGVSADGKLIILSAEGNDRFQRGLSFPEMWEVLEEFGAIIAGNCDGGSSSAVINKALSDKSLIVPSDGVEANVLNHVLIFSEPINIPDPEDPNEEPMTDFFVKVTTEQKERIAPSMFNANSREGQPVGTIIKVPAKVPADPDLKDNLIKDTDSRSDALFMKTSTGWYQPAFYKGQWNVVEVPDPTLPEEPPVPIPGDAHDISLTFAGIVVGKMFVNNEEWIRKI